jgi:hypothetical protein
MGWNQIEVPHFGSVALLKKGIVVSIEFSTVCTFSLETLQK